MLIFFKTFKKLYINIFKNEKNKNFKKFKYSKTNTYK